MACNLLYVGRCPPHRSGAAIRLCTLLNRLARDGYAIRALDPISPVSSDISGGYSWPFHHRVRLLDQYKCAYETTAADPGTAADRQRYAAYMEELLPRLVAAERTDLILLGGEYYAFGAARVARRLAIPTVLTPIGAFPAYFRGVFPEQAGCELLAEASNVDLIIACAEHLGHDLRATGLANVETVQNFVDTEKFSAGPRDAGLMRRFAIDAGDIVVLHVSNMTPPKRVLDLAAAAHLALRGEPRLRFLVVGDGPCKPALEAACAQHPIAGRVHFAGWIDHRQMPEVYRLADIVVLPSETEGLALTYLETQASGRVICASDIPAAREVIAHDETGSLFRMGDVGDLAEKILLAVGDKERRAAIGAKAQAFVQQRHSLDRAAPSYEALFERLIDRAVPQLR